jgi:phosphoglycerate kinase
MRKDFLTLDDFNFKNKTVILRIDINSPYNEKTKKIEISDRLIESAKTIKELSKKRAKVVILAHQGRKGDPDFLTLKQHSQLLTKYVGRKVGYVNDIIGKKAVNKIKSLKSREIILLDNVRFFPKERKKESPKEHSKSQLVQTLSPLANVFVNDAFSAAHRSHASIVGFTKVLPSVAGRTMEKEIKSIKKIITRMKISKHDTFVLGGAKPDEPLNVMQNMLKKRTLEKVLVSGVIAELFLIANGYKLGRVNMNFLKKKGYLNYIPQVKKLWERHKKKIEIPLDVAIEMNRKRKEFTIEELPINSQILDIGIKTCVRYAGIINESKSIAMKGPTGVYEKNGFDLGTRISLEAIANSRGFSLVGGGHTLSALSKFKINKNKFSHVSLGGGALITYLSGGRMPGIEALMKQ